MKHSSLMAWSFWLLILSVVVMFSSLLIALYIPVSVVFVTYCVPWIIAGLVFASIICGIIVAVNK